MNSEGDHCFKLVTKLQEVTKQAGSPVMLQYHLHLLERRF